MNTAPLGLEELVDDGRRGADVAQPVGRNRLVGGVLLVGLVLPDDSDGEPVVAAQKSHVVVPVGLLAAARELELDPMVANRVVHHSELIAVLAWQVDEDLRVMTMVNRAVVWGNNAQADEEEGREADEDDGVVAPAVRACKVTRSQADNCHCHASDHHEDVAEAQGDE